MSLLIKALANAEKDKQLKKNKLQEGAYVVDDALSFEPSFKPSPADELAKFTEETSVKEYAEDFDFVLSANDFTDDKFSLEAEAGLTPSTLSASAYANSKPSLGAPVNKVIKQDAGNFGEQAPAVHAVEANQKAAAKVFVANQSAKAPTSKSALLLLGVAGALIIWLGLQGYTYIQSPVVPQVVVVKPASSPPTQPQAVTSPKSNVVATTAIPSQDAPVVNKEVAAESEDNSHQAKNNSATNSLLPNHQSDAGKANIVAKNEGKLEAATEHADDAASNAVVEREQPKAMHARRLLNNNDEPISGSELSHKREPLRLVSKLPSTGVDPTLLSAYQAFTRGEDASAQQQYRQVLQHDVRNIDALLGMAAIAQRQGREADATGWYQKVLEVEPRNTIAQSAIVSPQAGNDAVATESRIKSMLAQQPDAANLHAALGNLYAEQNQWASAQEAYFNATRYAPNNADYAFNMAISLDQLGKSNLALNQYQRALALINKSGATSPDRATLEARIRALQ